MLNKIWKEGGLPEEWKEEIVTPINKKGGRKKTNYRGIALMDSRHKIYAEEKLSNT